MPKEWKVEPAIDPAVRKLAALTGYKPTRKACACERPPTLPYDLSEWKDPLCPPCRVYENVDHLHWLDEQFKTRGGIFQSKDKVGHQNLRMDWVKTKVVLAKLISRCEELVESEDKCNKENGVGVDGLETSGGVIAALIVWRDHEKDAKHIVEAQHDQKSDWSTRTYHLEQRLRRRWKVVSGQLFETSACLLDTEEGPPMPASLLRQHSTASQQQIASEHSIIFPQFRPNSMKTSVTLKGRNGGNSPQTLAGSPPKSSMKSLWKHSSNDHETSTKHICINDMVMVSPEHLNHSHFEAPILSRSPTQQPHNKHVDAEHKIHRARLARSAPCNISRKAFWASPEGHEKVNTSSFKVAWGAVEEAEKRASLYNRISGAWILFWFLSRGWEMLDWKKLRKEFKKRIGDWGEWRKDSEEEDKENVDKGTGLTTTTEGTESRTCS